MPINIRSCRLAGFFVLLGIHSGMAAQPDIAATSTAAQPLGSVPATVDATWNGGIGNWTEANWTFVPSDGFDDPNNTAEHLFNVAIDAGLTSIDSVVSVNANRAILSLTLDAGDQVRINNAQRLSILESLVNNGLLRIDASTSNTFLQPVGTVSFSGSGSVELGGNNAWLYDGNNSNAAPDHLIQEAGHSIRGVGNIGFSNNLQITNHGLIEANSDGNTLTIAPNNAGMINSNTLRASNGGNLVLNGSSLGSALIDNESGSIEAMVDSAVTYINGAHVLGGELVGHGPHVIGSGSPKRFENVTVNTTININNAQRLSLIGTIVNNGLIRLDATTSSTYLQPEGTVALSGTGTVEMTGSNAWFYDATNANAAPDHLIQASGHTIRGLGTIGFQNNLQITNNGLIDADVEDGTLTVIPNNQGMVNSGTLRASSGGNLSISGTSLGGALIDNSDGVIEALSGSTASYINGARISGGLLTGQGSHLIGSGSPKRFEDLTLQAEVGINNAQRLQLSGQIINDGTISINAVGANTYLQPAGTLTLGGSGSVEMKGNLAWFYGTDNLGFLIHQAGHTIRGAGNLGFQSTLQINNRGLIHANIDGASLTITPNTQLRNTGTLRASDGATLDIVTSFGSFASLISNLLLEGSYEVIGNSVMRLSSPVNNNNGTIVLDGPDARLYSTGTNDALAGLAINQRDLTIRGGRDFTTAGSFSNSGTLHIGAGSTFTVAAEESLTSSGTLTGSGVIVGDVTSTGVLAPGDDIGTLTIEGELLFNDGVSYQWQISSNGSDLVEIVDNDLILAGDSLTIQVQIDESDVPVPGSDHVLVNVSGGEVDILQMPDIEIQLPSGWTSDGVVITATQVLLSNLALQDEIFHSRFED